MRIRSCPPLSHNPADSLDGLSRPAIRGRYQEHDCLHEFESMVQHEAFQLRVVLSAPMRAGKKGPTDFNFSFLEVQSEVPRRTDSPLSLPVDDNKGTPRFQRLPEKLVEHLFLVTIAGRMLLPNQRVRSHCEQAIPIIRPKRPKLKKVANEVRLQLEHHPVSTVPQRRSSLFSLSFSGARSDPVASVASVN